MTALMKVRWALYENEDLKEFRGSLKGYTVAVEVLIGVVHLLGSLKMFLWCAHAGRMVGPMQEERRGGTKINSIRPLLDCCSSPMPFA